MVSFKRCSSTIDARRLKSNMRMVLMIRFDCNRYSFIALSNLVRDEPDGRLGFHVPAPDELDSLVIDLLLIFLPAYRRRRALALRKGVAQRD